MSAKVSQTSAITHLLAIEIRRRVGDTLLAWVGAVLLQSLEEFTVHDIEWGRVSTCELWVGRREDGITDRGTDKVSTD